MKAALRNRNLFVRAHEAQHGSEFSRIGSGWEDTLTDQLAFLLAADNDSREALVKRLLSSRAEPVIGIATQVQYHPGCPDLQIRLASGRLLLLEHKVDASLQQNQIERYLEIEDELGRPAYVSLISRKHLNVSEAVLNNERYLRPEGGAHWFWSDLYDWLPTPKKPFGSEWVRRCFLDYLELIGLAPSLLPDQWEGLLSNDPDCIPVQDEFGRKLFLVRAYLSDRGFSVVGDSHSGLNASPPGDANPYHHLTVGPTRARRDQMKPDDANKVTTAVFRVALVYDFAEPPPEALELYRRLDSPITDGNGFLWYPVAPHSMTNKRTRLSLVSSLGQFLNVEQNIAERLQVGFLAAMQTLTSC